MAEPAPIDESQFVASGEFATVAAAARYPDINAPERMTACRDTGQYRFVALYMNRQGHANNLTTVRTQIRKALKRANYLVHDETQRSSNNNKKANLDFRCNPENTQPAVRYGGAVPTRSFAQAVTVAKANGFNHPREKYVIFGDYLDPQGSYCGWGDSTADDRRIVNNKNNGGTGSSTYALTFKNCWDWRTPLHEMIHMLGGVQSSAPEAISGHTHVGSDVMYASGNGHPNDEPDQCAHMRLDCGKNTYFDANPSAGSYLATHWNIGWDANRYINIY
ncbi:MAG: hypothetical protein GX542_12880 [Rhodococcus sp.]|nr:hypothetical protein [Rhodococcus sp. (in: high G+C Gram-positive bacteria)]